MTEDRMPDRNRSRPKAKSWFRQSVIRVFAIDSDFGLRNSSFTPPVVHAGPSPGYNCQPTNRRIRMCQCTEGMTRRDAMRAVAMAAAALAAGGFPLGFSKAADAP